VGGHGERPPPSGFPPGSGSYWLIIVPVVSPIVNYRGACPHPRGLYEPFGVFNVFLTPCSSLRAVGGTLTALRGAFMRPGVHSSPTNGASPSNRPGRLLYASAESLPQWALPTTRSFWSPGGHPQPGTPRAETTAFSDSERQHREPSRGPNLRATFQTRHDERLHPDDPNAAAGGFG